METDVCRASRKHSEITETVIGAAFAVHNVLGAGFVEIVYENALAIELAKASLSFEKQAPLKVFYKGETVGDFRVDLFVEGKVLVELKAVERLLSIHEAQLLNYLKASEFKVGLLINFGKSVQVKRRVW